MLRKQVFSEVDQDSSLQQIPGEILLHILSFTDYKTLMRMSTVAKFLTPISLDNALWKEEIRKEYPHVKKIADTLISNTGYFEFFKKHYKPYYQTMVSLNYRGDELSIQIFSPGNGQVDGEYRPASANDRIHPILKKELACTSYDAVIALLTKIKNTPDCLQDVKLFLENKPLKGGGYSLCSIDAMIEHAEHQQAAHLTKPKEEDRRSTCCLS